MSNEIIISSDELNHNITVVEDDGTSTVETQDNNVDVETPTITQITSSDGLPSINDTTNTALSHALLTNRDSVGQHPIAAITGLRTELDNIEALQTVSSDKANMAAYYAWDDENYFNQDRSGYFVSFVQGTRRIVIGGANIIGVTTMASDIGFIGNNSTSLNTYQNGLVCTQGLIKVRALSTVAAGDYVISNTSGIAQKTSNGYGYKVVYIDDTTGVYYAVINLTDGTMQAYDLANTVSSLSTRLTTDESNITTAINTANNAVSANTQTNTNVSNLQTQVNNVSSVANEANTAASNANATTISLIQGITGTTTSDTTALKTEVANKINGFTEDIEDLTEDVEPITTWTDGTNTGAQYLVNHIANNLATKTEVNNAKSYADTKMTEAINTSATAIQTNAQKLQTIAVIEHKYVVGDHSPSYRLSLVDAQNTLVNGLVYVPTVNVTETMTGVTEGFNFIVGNCYTWTNTAWSVQEGVVTFSASYIAGGNNILYWYISGTDITNNNIIYSANALYKWIADSWIEVANITQNSTMRVASYVYQTANTLSASITNTNGALATLQASVDNNTAELSGTITPRAGGPIASLKAKTDENTAIASSVTLYDNANLINSLALSAAPTGTFYLNAPTWNDNKWEFGASEVALDTAQSPCYALVGDGSSEYYQYICGTYNTWYRNTLRHSSSLAAIQQQVGDDEAKISLVVSTSGGTNSVNAASIVTAVNDSGSSVYINAGKLDFDGTNISMSASNDFSITAGTAFSLNKDGIKFSVVDNSSNNVFAVDVPNKTCSIGGFTVDSDSIYHTKTAYNDSNNGVYIGTDGIGLGAGKFYVTSAGALTATDVTVTGVLTTAAGSSISANYIVGTLSADHIDASSLSVDAANITGTLTVGALPSSVVTAGNNISRLTNDSGYIAGSDIYATNTTQIDGGKIKTGTISASNITTGYLNADRISGGTLDFNYISVANLTVSHAASADKLSVTSGSLDLQYNGATIASFGPDGGSFYELSGSSLNLDVQNIDCYAIDATSISCTGVSCTGTISGSTISCSNLSISSKPSLNVSSCTASDVASALLSLGLITNSSR